MDTTSAATQLSAILSPEFTADLVDEHLDWLSRFDVLHSRNWERLASNDLESALCEAGVRRLLQSEGASVEPAEDLAGAAPRPDFQCRRGTRQFAVEVVSISVENATEHSGLEHVPQTFAHYETLNDWVFRAAIRKTRQCCNSGCPTLIAVGTFHWSAARACFRSPIVDMLLTGKSQIGWDIDVRAGRAVGEPYTFTELAAAVFLKPDDSGTIAFARSPISGLLLCGLSLDPVRTLGIRHPNPDMPFPLELLPDVAFCDVLIDGKPPRLSTRWNRVPTRLD